MAKRGSIKVKKSTTKKNLRQSAFAKAQEVTANLVAKVDSKALLVPISQNQNLDV